ncbi:MAG: serine hydrolase [Sphingobacteriaceae bacterium]
MKKYVLPFLLFTVLHSNLLIAQNFKAPAFITDSLNTYIQKSMTNWRVPGAAVCIVKDGRIVWMKGYGVKEMSTNNKVDEHTLFMIGGNTMAFTATVIAMLETQKKLSLEDKVTKYIPDFKLENKFAAEQATIRDLLGNRLGFGTLQGNFTYWTSDLSRQEVIAKMDFIKAAYSFRTTWGYNNAAFLTAGEIIPKVNEKSWEAFLKESIFAPLGMSNTLALSKDLPAAINKSAAHTMVDGVLRAIPYPQIDNLAPAVSISSSINDMSKWILMLLDNGKSGNREIISPSAIKKIWEPTTIIGNINRPFKSSNFALYGLGWELQEYQGRKLVMHPGGVNGFLSSVTLVPEENLGIIILTNTDQNYFFDALKWDILNAYFNLPFKDYNKSYLNDYRQRTADEQKKNKKLRDTTAMLLKPALSLNAYTGKYNNEIYGYLTITKNDNELQVKFEHHPKLFARLQPLGGNRFYATFSDAVFDKAVFPFQVINGKIKSLTVKLGDFIESTPYEFTKLP